jgi:hypothetical protein
LGTLTARLRLVILLTVLLGTVFLSSQALAATYVANCGMPGYLDMRPTSWSGGCTAGALNIRSLRWSEYLSGKAAARGRSQLRYPCGVNPTCPHAPIYTAPALLRFSAARRCTSGEAQGERYFSQVRVRVLMRRGNPFGYRTGWRTWHVSIPRGECSYAPS